MWQTADDFGYETSPEVGLRTAGIEERIGRAHILQTRQVRSLSAIAALVSPVFLGVLLGVIDESGLPVLIELPLLAIVVVVGLGLVVGLLSFSRMRRPSVRSVLGLYHWEVWPCAVLPMDPPNGWGRDRPCVWLLRPDGSYYVKLITHWSRETHENLARRGVGARVWFAGDLRHGGVVALPDGIEPTLADAVGCSGEGTATQNERATEAGLRRRSNVEQPR
ncbi:hypothetical protein [Embleya sp. NPDC001921]